MFVEGWCDPHQSTVEVGVNVVRVEVRHNDISSSISVDVAAFNVGGNRERIGCRDRAEGVVRDRWENSGSVIEILQME